MTTFKLDTSGEVRRCDGQQFRLHDTYLFAVTWSDLSPFVQGCIETALRDAELMDRVPPEGEWRHVGFSDLAPETLARIMEDCERRIGHLPTYRQADDRQNVDYGRLFWVRRQAGDLIKFGFPPLTLYLRDDGRIHHREGA